MNGLIIGDPANLFKTDCLQNKLGMSLLLAVSFMLCQFTAISLADTVPSAVPLIVYDDVLQSGFVGNEWVDGENHCLLNLDYTNEKASGTASIELNLNHYCTVFFTQPGHWDAGVYHGGFDVSAYSYLEFDLYAVPPEQATFGITLASNSWTPSGTQVLIGDYATPSNQWKHVKIPMGNFNLAPGTLVEGFQLRNNEWQTNNNVYGSVLIDNVAFTPNLDPPTVIAANSNDLKHIKISFSKQVNPTDAINTGNYTLVSEQDNSYKNPTLPLSASISPDRLSVILTAAIPLQNGFIYTVTLNNIADRLTPPHLIAPDTKTTFTALFNPLAIRINAATGRHPISPQIYGLAFAPASTLADLNFTLNRQGGNPSSTYNWQQNADNRSFDWFFESLPQSGGTSPAGFMDSFITDNRASGSDSMITIPTIGWMAKLGPNRERLASFSQSKYGLQTASDPWFPDAGNGILQSTGQAITNNDPNDAYVVSDVYLQSGFVSHLVNQWGMAEAGGVKYYNMDNESSIWQDTHRDIHPVGPTMTEVRDDIISYGSMVKQQDPTALVVAPEEWGWPGYFYSGYDQQYANAHGWSYFPDRIANGGMEYMPWLLDQLHQNEIATGRRILDIFSLHIYPQSGEYSTDISPRMLLLRNRSTRSLWDPNYTDESWINDKVYLIPRMKQWVNQYYPGLKIGITEYNWGAEANINGATALADILGIFGREGLDLATYWTVPAPNTPVYLAMKLYRNYDGNKSTFGDISVSDVVPNPDEIASFAALDSKDGALTVMAINKQLETDTDVVFQVENFSGSTMAQAYQLTANGMIEHISDYPFQGNSLEAYLPAQSVTLFIIPAKIAVKGDLNGDGIVNCADLMIAKASFGKRTGQAGFDARADVNKDGVVDIRDLSFVSRQIPIGTKCS